MTEPVATGWGWGAIAVDGAPKGWLCPVCRSKARKGGGRHWYPFTVACTSCASTAYRAHTARTEELGQGVSPGQSARTPRKATK
jgi:hypothetical protein